MDAKVNLPVTEKPKLSVRNLDFYYGGFHALKNITLDIPERRVTAFIGPSGCGKSTLLRTFNRMYELYPEQRATGEILIDGSNLLTTKEDVSLIRAKIGMVFQKPTPFPMSIYDNIAFGVKLFETLPRIEMDERVEWALKKAALWGEVKDKLNQSGSGLSGGQQQRLCIARGIAIKPEVLLLDEPCSALDPISTGKIEELIHELKTDYTVVIVTHNMQQAARCSDYTAYMYLGRPDRVRLDHRRLHAAEEEGHRGLHHRPLRLSRIRPRRNSHDRQAHVHPVRCRAERGLDPGSRDGRRRRVAGRARGLRADPVQQRGRRRGAGDRGPGQRDRGRDRPRPLDHHRKAPADRPRPAPPDRDLEDDRQPGAGRRRGGADRAHRPAAGQFGHLESAAPAGQRPRLRVRARGRRS